MLVEVAHVGAGFRAGEVLHCCLLRSLLQKWQVGEKEEESRVNSPLNAAAFCRTTIAVDRAAADSSRTDSSRDFPSCILFFAAVNVYELAQAAVSQRGHMSHHTHLNAAQPPTRAMVSPRDCK